MQVLITGSDGRIGRILRITWSQTQSLPFQPIWSTKKGCKSGEVVWDVLTGPAPSIAKGATILHLAGVLQGDAAVLATNVVMAQKVCAAAQAAGAKHVFLASSASIYGGSDRCLSEAHAPSPCSNYGRAKLQMERDALCWASRLGSFAPGVTCLRIGNVLGADALFGNARSMWDIVLDPVPGQKGGPLRSYIGPKTLAFVLAKLIEKVGEGISLPPVLNIAQPGAVFMADLLTAAERPFIFGLPNADVVPKVDLSTKRLEAFVPVPLCSAISLVADWQSTLSPIT
jgi:nucleoside-diphosphate-sugar epimerase